MAIQYLRFNISVKGHR